ncbi:MAG TPA: rhomboid family intramembrane serine protease [Candidatus Lokiarchaeia archaeon]
MMILDVENFKKAKITLGLITINVVFFVVFNILLGVEYVLLFSQINSKVFEGQIYRLFTSMFLHADIIHLFSNMLALLIFGTSVENNFYKYQFLLIYFLSGFLGNIFSLYLLPYDSISLGASGAIFGLIGAVFVFFAREDKTFILFGLIYLIFFIFMSLAPGINLWAHLFGLLGGLILGYLFKNKTKRFEYYE